MQLRFSIALLAAFLPTLALQADDAPDPPRDPLELLNRPHETLPGPPLSSSTRPADQDLTKPIKKGFDFIDKWQSPNGSWDRTGELDEMLENDWDLPWRIIDNKEYRDGIVKDLPEAKENENVADTALAARAMLTALTAGQHPEYEPKIKKSIEFLCNQIDTWNGGEKVKTIYIQKRIFDPIHDQTPALGEARYYDATVDTFFTLSFLAQARERLTDEKLLPRVDRALRILQKKIESTQDIHGTWIDDTDPLAKINDKISRPPVIHPPIPPMHGPRVSPDNPKLPEDVLAKAELYDPDHKNILVHCQQLRDISIAARLGVDLNLSTRWRAEGYLKNNFLEKRWEAMGEGPYTRNICPKAILLASVVAAWYQADLAAHVLADEAQKKTDAGERLPTNHLAALKIHAQETRAQLEHVTRRFIAYDNLPICGPALENLTDCLQAVEIFSPPAAKTFGDRLKTAMLARQRPQGNFIAGPNDNWIYYEWIGSDRGESIFGTSTTLQLLMYLNRNNTALTKPASTPAPATMP